MPQFFPRVRFFGFFSTPNLRRIPPSSTKHRTYFLLDNRLPPVVVSVVSLSHHPRQNPTDPSGSALFLSPNTEPPTSNLCLFMRFRTLDPQRSAPNPLFSLCSALFPMQRRGGGAPFSSPFVFNNFQSPHLWAAHPPKAVSHQSRITSHDFQRLTNCPRFATLLEPLSFQPLPRCPICMSFISCNMPGVAGYLPFSSFTFPFSGEH